MNEKQLFQYLKDNVYKDLVFAKKQFSRWDCYSPQYKARIELKSRNKHYPTMLIQKDKYDALKLKAEGHNDAPLYINSTPEGIYLWDLRKVNPVWQERMMPKTTEFNQKHYIKKVVGFLNISDAVVISKTN